MTKTPGEMAYTAYAQSREWKAYNDTPIPQWVDVRDDIKASWEDAAKCVIRKQQPFRGFRQVNHRLDAMLTTNRAFRDRMYGDMKKLKQMAHATLTLVNMRQDEVAEKAINDWREAEQWCSSEDLNDEEPLSAKIAGRECLTVIAPDGKTVYTYRLVDTRHAVTSDEG